MRRHIRLFVQAVEDHIGPLEGPIYEFGARVVHGANESDVDLRSFFPDREYIRCDFIDGENVDRVLDLHHIDLPDEIAANVICVETLEHVKYPWLACQEIYRILKTGGLFICNCEMHYAIHNHPSDYWRTTPEGLKVLLEPFQDVWIEWAGVPSNPHTVVGIARKGMKLPDLAGLRKKLIDDRILWQKEDSVKCCE